MFAFMETYNAFVLVFFNMATTYVEPIRMETRITGLHTYMN